MGCGLLIARVGIKYNKPKDIRYRPQNLMKVTKMSSSVGGFLVILIMRGKIPPLRINILYTQSDCNIHT